jgi:hypothetical protein
MITRMVSRSVVMGLIGAWIYIEAAYKSNGTFGHYKRYVLPMTGIMLFYHFLVSLGDPAAQVINN